MASKLVVVLGATGLQGGSVVNALQALGKYAIRGVTRKTTSAESQALTAQGVDMVAGDTMDKQSLLDAFKGAYAVFGVTAPFQPMSETEQGKNIVDACKANNVPLLVWSSLNDATKLSNGKYTKVKLWDEKAAVDDYIQVVEQPAVIVIPGGFTENIQKFDNLHRNPSDPNKFLLSWPVLRPSVPHAYTYIGEDYGACVVAAIDHWQDPVWKEKLTQDPIPTCSYWATGAEMVEMLKRVSGKEVEYEITSMPNEMLTEMMQIADDGLVFKGLDFPTPLFVEMGVKFHTFEDYVRKELLPLMKSEVQVGGTEWAGS